MKQNSGQRCCPEFFAGVVGNFAQGFRVWDFSANSQPGNAAIAATPLIRQPFGLPPSPKGKALAGATTYNLAYQGAIPSCTQECNEYLPACARIDSGGTPPIPSGAQGCYEYLPACARTDSGGTPPIPSGAQERYEYLPACARIDRGGTLPIPSGAQECYEYLPACTRIDRGGTLPIPSGAQGCYEYLPACARIDSGGTSPRIVRRHWQQNAPSLLAGGKSLILRTRSQHGGWVPRRWSGW